MLQLIFGKNLTEKLRVIDTDKEDAIKSRDVLQKEVSRLQVEVEQLKSKKKIEEEDIKHMIKMQEEALAVEKQRYELKLMQEKDTAIARVKDEYRQKLEGWLIDKNKESDSRFQMILERLPNVNMSIKQSTRGSK